MDQANFASENLKNTMVTVEAMQAANKELKKQYKNVNIDKIETLQDEMEDMLEQANLIQETLGRTYGLPEDVDEADLEAELDALGTEMAFEEEETPVYLAEPADVPLPEPGAALPAAAVGQPNESGRFKLNV
ncbi:MAG: hypothetical protein BJ554DRAFT_1180 [Olpidium bornovanus]|uniref:Charged multivesicular body protein 5 n=1 Tax=Olpidium bornovanus TaxID=278681 RepID=A0A8H8DHN6_9FUNG|nr:MAG: hypothetical protein BJ554DRAFT_1180 [Olpidium bornovanus]